MNIKCYVTYVLLPIAWGPKKFLQKLAICAIFIGDSKHITLAEKVRYINPYRVIKLLA